MTTADLTSNYFDLFKLPISFEVDLKGLSERYRSLQNSVHPDRFANASDMERRLSVQQSARINEAFQTLKNPLSRAKYLLEINGIDMNADTDTQMDPQFLMQQMELRESLGEVKNSVNPIDELLKINNNIDQSISSIILELKRIFPAGQPGDLAVARDCVRRLQFMIRLQEEAQSLEEMLV